MDKMENKIDKLKLRELVITQKTLEKIKKYSEIVCENGNIECYGFLLNPKEQNNNISYNAILAFGQEADSISAKINPVDVFETKVEIKNMGYVTIGCWHSHHNMGAFHSSTDNSNLERLVRSIACNREISEKKELPEGYFPSTKTENELLIRGEGVEIIIKSQNPIDFSQKYLQLKKNLFYGYTKTNKLFVNINNRISYFDLDEHTILFKRSGAETLSSLGYAYSLVVSKNKTYAELALKKTCNTCGNNPITREPVQVRIIAPEKDIIFSEDEIRDEIKKKVKISRGIFNFLK